MLVPGSSFPVPVNTQDAPVGPRPLPFDCVVEERQTRSGRLSGGTGYGANTRLALAVNVDRLRSLLGPSPLAQAPMVVGSVALDPLTNWPSSVLARLYEGSVKVLPGLSLHACMWRSPLHVASAVPHALVHMALELQRQVAYDSRLARCVVRDLTADIGIGYEDPLIGLACVQAAARLIEILARGRRISLNPVLKELRRMAKARALSESLNLLAEAATRRDLPVRRLFGASSLLAKAVLDPRVAVFPPDLRDVDRRLERFDLAEEQWLLARRVCPVLEEPRRRRGHTRVAATAPDAHPLPDLVDETVLLEPILGPLCLELELATLLLRLGDRDEVAARTPALRDVARDPFIAEPEMARRFSERRVQDWVFDADVRYVTREGR